MLGRQRRHPLLPQLGAIPRNWSTPEVFKLQVFLLSSLESQQLTLLHVRLAPRSIN